MWRVVAGAGPGRHWYADAGPFVFRGLVDRALLGAGRRWPVPDRALLRAGDRAGFWKVVEAGPVSSSDADGRRLVLDAAVRAPGLVTFRSHVVPEAEGTRLTQTVTFTPHGLLGHAYLLADLPAREALMELVHRRVLADLPGGHG